MLANNLAAALLAELLGDKAPPVKIFDDLVPPGPEETVLMEDLFDQSPAFSALYLVQSTLFDFLGQMGQELPIAEVEAIAKIQEGMNDIFWARHRTHKVLGMRSLNGKVALVGYPCDCDGAVPRDIKEEIRKVLYGLNAKLLAAPPEARAKIAEDAVAHLLPPGMKLTVLDIRDLIK